MTRELKIMVVDDSVTQRHILSRVIGEFDNVELVGTASSGEIALKRLDRLQPDLVILDVFLTGMSGTETLQKMKQCHPDLDVVMFSGTAHQDARIVVEALEAGALDFIQKPSGLSSEESYAILRSAISRLIPLAITRKYSRKALSYSITQNAKQGPNQCKYNTEDRSQLVPSNYRKVTTKKCPPISAIGIGVSTGGPSALQKIIPNLKGDLPVPVFIVQHMPPEFTGSLASRLDAAADLHVVEAKNGQIVEQGMIYIAPGGHHMVVRKKGSGQHIIGLVDSPPVNSCRPSVDVLFRSMANVYESNVLAIILTGMGSDGTDGVAAIRRQGGYCIAQDEKSSLVWGMPGSVVSANYADEIVALDQIPLRINAICR